MIRIKQAVIVEGKYDKIKLDNIIDAIIITTDGFNIFKNEKTKNYIKKLADEKGIIILTDSDSAGMMIRSKIREFVSGDKITDVYIPQIKGKERRKEYGSAEGVLGVEGVDDKIILSALKNAGVTEQSQSDGEKITKQELYNSGLYGNGYSSELRKQVCLALNLPDNLTVNRLLSYVNKSNKAKEFRKAVELCRQKKDNG